MTGGGYTDLRNVPRTTTPGVDPPLFSSTATILASVIKTIAGARLLRSTTDMGGTRASGYELIVKLWDEQRTSIVGVEGHL